MAVRRLKKIAGTEPAASILTQTCECTRRKMRGSCASSGGLHTITGKTAIQFPDAASNRSTASEAATPTSAVDQCTSILMLNPPNFFRLVSYQPVGSGMPKAALPAGVSLCAPDRPRAGVRLVKSSRLWEREDRPPQAKLGNLRRCGWLRRSRPGQS
jgi:hypothetical protein